MSLNHKEIHLTQLFETIFKDHYPSVKYFAYVLLKSEEDSEDIAQDVFAKLWSNPDLWSKNENIDNYLYVMTRNATFNFIKHQKLKNKLQQQIMDQEEIERGLNERSLLDSIYYKESLLLIQLSLDCLPKRRKEIFMMSRFKKMTHNEIAKKLGISVRTVEGQIYLALKNIKKITFVILSLLLFR